MRRNKILEKISLKTIVFILIAVFFLTISVGYSYLKTQVSISGKATILANKESDYPQGDSICDVKLVNEGEQSEPEGYFYQYNVTITNLDEDVTSWEIEFDIPNSIDVISIKSSDASSVIFENGRVYLRAQSLNGYVSKGNSFEIGLQIAVSKQCNLNMDNFTFCGKLVTLNRIS